MKADKLRVVFDTSVYVSAFAFPESRSYKAYLLAVKGAIELYCSPEIINELVDKLTSNKFGLSSDDASKVVKRIGKTAIFVKPANTLHVLSDEPDNRIIECAVCCKAHLIVSGDHHLTDLKTYKNIGIVRAGDLLHIIR